MKKLINFIVVLNIFLYSRLGFASNAKEKLIIGYFELMPHSAYSKNSTDIGIALEYFNLIAKEMGIDNYEFKQFPLPRLLSNLKDNHIQMGLYLAKNSERQEIVNYASEPLFNLVPSLIIKATYQSEMITQNQIENLKICAWGEGYQSSIIKNKKNKIQLTGEDVMSRCTEMVSIGRVDGFYSPDQLALIYEIKRVKKEKELKVVPVQEESIGLYSVFSKNVSPGFIKRYDSAHKIVQEKINYIKFYTDKINSNKL